MFPVYGISLPPVYIGSLLIPEDKQLGKMTERAKTIVEYFAEHERYRCGYCGNTDTNYSHGMWAHMMNVQDYQDLLDRGWRRSGKYTYKPTMNMTCCPQYTIRCEVNNFKLRKSHKKVLKKVNKYLIHGIKPTKEEGEMEDEQEAGGSGSKVKEKSHSEQKPGDIADVSDKVEKTNDVMTEAEQNVQDIADVADRAEKLAESVTPSNDTTKAKSEVKERTLESKAECFGGSADSEGPTNQQFSKSVKQPRPGSGMDLSKPPCKKAKELRRERKLAKLSAKGGTAQNHQHSAKSAKQEVGKTLEDFINEPSKTENCAHRLEICLVRSNPESKEFTDSLTESHSVYHRYQMSIHGDPPDKPSMKQYKRFLVDSPLEEEHKEGGLPDGYGSFHQQYILDGKIICVGVLDILPSLVSSKYLYYDPDYNFLSLGTYSALQEIAFIRSLNKYSADMKYYYMGFYIHSCPKMKYKGQYYPSSLLCPETYSWHPVEQCAPKLDQQKYCRFADPQAVDANGTIDLSSVLVLFSRQLMTYQIYKALSRDKNEDEEEVKEYANFVGKKCSQSMLLFRK